MVMREQGEKPSPNLAVIGWSTSKNCSVGSQGSWWNEFRSFTETLRSVAWSYHDRLERERSRCIALMEASLTTMSISELRFKKRICQLAVT